MHVIARGGRDALQGPCEDADFQGSKAGLIPLPLRGISLANVEELAELMPMRRQKSATGVPKRWGFSTSHPYDGRPNRRSAQDKRRDSTAVVGCHKG